MSLRITQISIRDTFGTKLAKFSPKSVTRISGPNGSGKSSILRGLTKVFEGGSDPSIIRRGAEESSVEIHLSDGTIITRTCAPKKRRRNADGPTEYATKLEVIQPDGTPRNAPKEYVDQLSESVAVDPGQILRIDVTTAPGRKQLADVFLRIMPIEFTAEDMRQSLGPKYREGSPVANFDADSLALPVAAPVLDLDGLKKYAAQVSEQRRRVGVTRDDAEGTIKRLTAALPDDDGADYNASLEKAEAYRIDVERAIGARRTDIETQAKDALAGAEKTYRDAAADIDRDIDAQIRELEKKRTTRKAAAMGERDAAKNQIGAKREEELTALEAEAKPVVEKCAAEIATLKEKLANAQRAKFQREEIDHQRAVLGENSYKYDLLTEALARLDLMRAEKLNSLPIPGLVVEGDQVLLNGTPWQNVNTAKRVEVALQLCALRAGELGVLFLDDAEHLDSETRKLLEHGIAESGFQLIEAIVSTQDGLTIETIDSHELSPASA